MFLSKHSSYAPRNDMWKMIFKALRTGPCLSPGANNKAPLFYTETRLTYDRFMCIFQVFRGSVAYDKKFVIVNIQQKIQIKVQAIIKIFSSHHRKIKIQLPYGTIQADKNLATINFQPRIQALKKPLVDFHKFHPVFRRNRL